MALQLRLQAGTVNPSQECLSTLTGVLQAVARYVTVITQGGITALTASEAEPSVDNRNTAWVKLDNNGFPLGLYWYNDGSWRRVPEANIGEIKLATGDCADIPEGWAVANGVAPSTVNLTAQGLWDPNYTNANPGTSYNVMIIEFVGHS